MCTYTNSFGSLAETEYSSVAIDDRQAARLAVDTLVNLGHRRIALVCDEMKDNSISELRSDGYRAALEAHGIAYDPALIVETKSFSDLHAIYESVRGLVERKIEFTAVFAIADIIAIAAIKALSDCGRHVPEGCSVVAIDGLEISAYTLPTLTTFVQPAGEMGVQCARILIDLIEGRGDNRHATFEPSLRGGGSVCRLTD
jgi:LacI family transcriptional regulator